ncbi:MAG: cellulose biosynthesis protein BcsQ [Cyclobacteriaceae bacterium]|jgi:cellulose biosynthesis protein BcsQ
MHKNNIIQTGIILETAKELFGKLILNTTIGSSTRVREANSLGLSILDFEPDNPVAKDFENLCDEILSKLHEIKTLESVLPLINMKA